MFHLTARKHSVPTDHFWRRQDHCGGSAPVRLFHHLQRPQAKPEGGCVFLYLSCKSRHFYSSVLRAAGWFQVFVSWLGWSMLWQSAVAASEHASRKNIRLEIFPFYWSIMCRLPTCWQIFVFFFLCSYLKLTVVFVIVCFFVCVYFLSELQIPKSVRLAKEWQGKQPRGSHHVKKRQITRI